jgi:hypothetical protein
VNRLDPELRWILRKARRTHSGPLEAAPGGFAERVAASWAAGPIPPSISTTQQLVSAVAWVSCAVILCGSLFLLEASPDSVLETRFSTTAQFLAQDFIP